MYSVVFAWFGCADHAGNWIKHLCDFSCVTTVLRYILRFVLMATSVAYRFDHEVAKIDIISFAFVNDRCKSRDEICRIFIAGPVRLPKWNDIARSIWIAISNGSNFAESVRIANWDDFADSIRVANRIDFAESVWMAIWIHVAESVPIAIWIHVADSVRVASRIFDT